MTSLKYLYTLISLYKRQQDLVLSVLLIPCSKLVQNSLY